MKPGDKLRFIGPAGAPFVVTVGPAFAPEYIAERVEAGEWRPVEPEPEPEPEPKPTPRRTRAKKTE